jgi:hypothetical protein
MTASATGIIFLDTIFLPNQIRTWTVHVRYLGRPVYAEAFALTPVLILSTLEAFHGGALGWPLRVCRDLISP